MIFGNAEAERRGGAELVALAVSLTSTPTLGLYHFLGSWTECRPPFLPILHDFHMLPDLAHFPMQRSASLPPAYHQIAQKRPNTKYPPKPQAQLQESQSTKGLPDYWNR